MIPLKPAREKEDLRLLGMVSECGNRSYAEISVCDITEVGVHDSIKNTVPLTLLSWDIEVSTRSGKFDDDGHDEENRIICICYTIGDPCSLAPPTKSVCIVTEDCGSTAVRGD